MFKFLKISNKNYELVICTILIVLPLNVKRNLKHHVSMDRFKFNDSRV